MKSLGISSLQQNKAGLEISNFEISVSEYPNSRTKITLGARGELEVYMMGGGGGLTYFFWLKIYTLGIFLGQEICHVFFRS